MKTQKATKIYGNYSYEIALAEDGRFFSRSFINGKTTKWEAMALDLADPTRNLPLQPGPYKARLPL